MHDAKRPQQILSLVLRLWEQAGALAAAIRDAFGRAALRSCRDENALIIPGRTCPPHAGDRVRPIRTTRASAQSAQRLVHKGV
jgi:hypothetical protein